MIRKFFLLFLMLTIVEQSMSMIKRSEEDSPTQETLNVKPDVSLISNDVFAYTIISFLSLKDILNLRLASRDYKDKVVGAPNAEIVLFKIKANININELDQSLESLSNFFEKSDLAKSKSLNGLVLVIKKSNELDRPSIKITTGNRKIFEKTIDLIKTTKENLLVPNFFPHETCSTLCEYIAHCCLSNCAVYCLGNLANLVLYIQSLVEPNKCKKVEMTPIFFIKLEVAYGSYLSSIKDKDSTITSLN